MKTRDNIIEKALELFNKRGGKVLPEERRECGRGVRRLLLRVAPEREWHADLLKRHDNRKGG